MKKTIKTFLKVTLLLTFFFQGVVGANEYLKLGDENAKVTVKVFSSLTCPHCANFHNKIFYDLKKEYINNSKVKFEHHSFPLDLAALNAEIIIRCQTDKKLQFDLLGEIYKKQSEWAIGSDIEKINNYLIDLAENLNLKESKIKKCLKDENIQEKILYERIEAQKKYNISSTPTIIINDKKYEGPHEFEDFKKQLNKYL